MKKPSLSKSLRGILEKQIHRHDPRSVLDTKEFPWVKEIEEHTEEIIAELTPILGATDTIVNFMDVLKEQNAFKNKINWKSYYLNAFGETVIPHQKACPQTFKALNKIPGLLNAFFSILGPGEIIPPHRGPYSGILRYQLGLIIPEGEIGIKVNGEAHRWKKGGSLIFDDSFEHEVWNRTAETRVILFVDFIRPLPQPLSIINHAVLRLAQNSKAIKEARKNIFSSLDSR